MNAQKAMASSAAESLNHRSVRGVVAAAALTGAAVTLVAASGLRAGATPIAVAGVSICFAWLFIPCVALGTRPGSARLHTWLHAIPRWRGAVLLALTFAGPIAYAWTASRVGSAAIAGFSLSDVTRLLVFEATVFVLMLVRPLERVGYSFELERHDLVTAFLAFAAFAAIAIPLGLATGFIHYGWRPFDTITWAGRAFYFYFHVALPEELIFRGLLQNVLERRFRGRRWTRALVIAALVFGAAHLGHPPVPNWRYGILASLAGVAYGWAWHRTGKITAAALTHAGVDLVWVLAFGGP